MRRRGDKFHVPRHPLVARLQQLCYTSNLGQDELAELAGINNVTLHAWFRGATPQLMTFEAVLGALGYKLVIVKDEKNDQRHPQRRTTNGPEQSVVGHEWSA